jgi:bifunctional non-homologous end joining protein LigD
MNFFEAFFGSGYRFGNKARGFCRTSLNRFGNQDSSTYGKRTIFDALKLESFPKTSGSKGLQIFVPLNTAMTYEKTKAFALALAERLEREHPNHVVSRMQRYCAKARCSSTGVRTTSTRRRVNVYSLRAKATPSVSTPVRWSEVASVAKKGGADRMVFDTEAALSA